MAKRATSRAGSRRSTGSGARLDTGRSFMAGAGQWAGGRFMAHMKETGKLEPAALRTNDTLTRDEWKAFDTAIVAEATIRLRGVADLINAGLTTPLPNAMAKTVLEYEKITDMDPATVSMDGMTRSENDAQEISMAGIPIPITHKDFFINLRKLMASRNNGEGLDVTQSRTAGRLVAEETERMLFQGGRTFGGLPIYGYMTHPNRNTIGFGGGVNWADAAKTGEQIITDIGSLISQAEQDRMWGPYWVYTSRNASLKMSADYKTTGDKTIRQRILEMDGITALSSVDQLPAGNVILVQATMDTVSMVDGEALQTIQWDVNGGMGVNFKAFAIQVPLIRADADGRSGLVHMS
jgi:Family of unknown function (DUF6260)